MISCDTCFLTLLLVSAFLVVSMGDRSWDIAVAIDNRIDFFTKDGTEVGSSAIEGADELAGLAYDSKNQTMYISDRGNKKAAIYSNHLIKEKNEIRTILNQTKIPSRQIQAVVFDPEEGELFWTDLAQHAIMKMKVHSEQDSALPQILHNLGNHSPFGLAIDICNGFIYWSSCDRVCSIEKSKLDGTQREFIVEGTTPEINGLAVDYSAGKLYWVVDLSNHKFYIERSDLNGTNKERIYEGESHNPVYIAVDKEAVYWTDHMSEAAWRMEKSGGFNGKPTEFKSYFTSKHNHNIMAIIAKDNIENIDCNAMPKGGTTPSEKSTTPIALVQSLEDHPIATNDVINAIKRPAINCLNEGRYEESNATCTCRVGFVGPLCETFLCHNYCVNGDCVFDAEGSPKCICGESYTGNKCERNICDGYCLNNGSCTVLKTGPSCECKNFTGQRCEYTTDLDKLCANIEETAISHNKTLCKSSQVDVNETLSKRIVSTNEPLISTIISGVLGSLILILVITVTVLSYQVHKLKRRPRIRKRFVVSKSGVTPLTSRPQLPADSCEITIENCCNMNICETPCFEPKLRATPTKSSSSKKEEKNSLLDSMEGADSC